MSGRYPPAVSGRAHRVEPDRGRRDRHQDGAQRPRPRAARRTCWRTPGREVLVLEEQPDPGGAVRSGDLTLPGYRHDRFSSFYPLGVASPVMRSMELERHGVRWRRHPIAVAHPGPDGLGRACQRRTRMRRARASTRSRPATATASHAGWSTGTASARSCSTRSSAVPARARWRAAGGDARPTRTARVRGGSGCSPPRRFGEEEFRGEGARRCSPATRSRRPHTRVARQRRLRAGPLRARRRARLPDPRGRRRGDHRRPRAPARRPRPHRVRGAGRARRRARRPRRRGPDRRRSRELEAGAIIGAIDRAAALRRPRRPRTAARGRRAAASTASSGTTRPSSSTSRSPARSRGGARHRAGRPITSPTPSTR